MYKTSAKFQHDLCEAVWGDDFTKYPLYVDEHSFWCFSGQNRKEGNDQESIQLSHTSHQTHQREKKTQTRNNWTLMETSLAKTQTDSYFPIKWPNGYPKQNDVSDTHIQRRTITKINHDRRTALERGTVSEKYFTGEGGGGGDGKWHGGGGVLGLDT